MIYIYIYIYGDMLHVIVTESILASYFVLDGVVFCRLEYSGFRSKTWMKFLWLCSLIGTFAPLAIEQVDLVS